MDLGDLLGQLHARGWTRLLTEGGPRLTASFSRPASSTSCASRSPRGWCGATTHGRWGPMGTARPRARCPRRAGRHRLGRWFTPGHANVRCAVVGLIAGAREATRSRSKSSSAASPRAARPLLPVARLPPGRRVPSATAGTPSPSGSHRGLQALGRQPAARLDHDHLAHAVREWKQSADGEQALVLGTSVTWNLMRGQGLVDELHLMVGKSVLGGGDSPLPRARRRVGALAGGAVRGSSNVLLRYARPPGALATTETPFPHSRGPLAHSRQ